MVISDDPNYGLVLKRIAKHLKENQMEALLLGRQGIIDFWLSCLQEAKKVGEKSITIITKDIHYIIDLLFGVEFT